MFLLLLFVVVHLGPRTGGDSRLATPDRYSWQMILCADLESLLQTAPQQFQWGLAGRAGKLRILVGLVGRGRKRRFLGGPLAPPLTSPVEPTKPDQAH